MDAFCRDAEEVMLVQAIQASLGVESEGNTEQLTNGTHRQVRYSAL